MKRLLLITDVFPPAFAPRMGYLCDYIKRNCGWKIVCVHSSGEDSDHGSMFRYLSGNVDEEYQYEWEDGIHGISFSEVIKQLFLRKKTVLDAVIIIIGKIAYKITNQGFNYSAKRLIRRILREQRFDVILGSGGGIKVYKIADYARKLSSLPLIQDLRDIEEERGVPLGLKGFWMRRIIKKRSKILDSASHIVVVVKSHMEIFSEFNSKMSLIYNGYDPRHFYFINKPNLVPKFTIVYIGSAYAKNCPLEKMINGIVYFCRQTFVKNKVQVQFFSTESCFHREIEPLIPLDMRAVFLRERMVPHEQVSNIFSTASVLLTMSQTKKGALDCIQTKAFEYLASGRPILNIAADMKSELEDIIDECRAGISASQEEDIVAFLNQKFNEWETNGVVAGTTDIEMAKRFSRESESEMFVRVMEDAISSDGNKTSKSV